MVKLCTDSHGPQRMACLDFGDPLAFHLKVKFEWNVSINIRWIAMKTGTETRVLFRRKDNVDYTTLIPLENDRAMKDAPSV